MGRRQHMHKKYKHWQQKKRSSSTWQREKHLCKITDDNRQGCVQGTLQSDGHMEHLCLTDCKFFFHLILTWCNQPIISVHQAFFLSFFFFLGSSDLLTRRNLVIPVRLAAWMKK